MRKIPKKSFLRTKVAKERIERLFSLAKENLEKNPKRSRNYVELARKIGMRYTVRLTKDQKRSFCKSCNQLLIVGKTSRVELDNQKKLIIIKCLNCDNLYRYPYKG